MWIFTSTGMVSCVRHTRKANTILVRARARDHVLNFIGPDSVDQYFYLDNCDYNHRAEISVPVFIDRLMIAANNITYPDFKGSIPKTLQHAAYYKACHDVWHCMNDFKFGRYDPKPQVPLYQLEGDDVDEELDRIFGKAEPSPMDMIDQQLGEVFGTESE